MSQQNNSGPSNEKEIRLIPGDGYVLEFIVCVINVVLALVIYNSDISNWWLVLSAVGIAISFLKGRSDRIRYLYSISFLNERHPMGRS